MLMTKSQMVAKLNGLQRKLSSTTDTVEREKLHLEIHALEKALVRKIRTQNDALRGGEKNEKN